mgnify:CR=1 FL=1
MNINSSLDGNSWFNIYPNTFIADGFKLKNAEEIPCPYKIEKLLNQLISNDLNPTAYYLKGIIFEEKGIHFDPDFAELFIKLVGVYPTGHIAELSSGEVGIIIKSSNEHRLKPKVLCVTDTEGSRMKEVIIDLNTNPSDENDKPIRLRAIHPNGAFGIDLKSYLKKGLRLSEYDE